MIKQRSAALGRSSLVIFIFIMRFTTELSPSQLPATARRITTIVSWQKWQSRIDNLRAEQAMNPIWDWFLRERHGLELAFGDIRQYMRTTSRCPWPPRTPKEYRLYSFMAVAVQIYSRLSQRGKARFAGAILSALEKEFGLGPLAFEVKVAAHLMGRGFEVDFHDLESGGGFDFLACQGETRIEVECKHISADIGRQIHRRKVYTLGGVLRPLIERAMNENPGGLFARVTLPGRLTGNKQEQEELAERIGSVMVGECVEVDDEICTVSRQSFELETSPFSVVRGRNLSLDDVLEYLHSEFGIENTNVISVWRPGHAAVLVSFESRKPDRVLDKILSKLKADAKKQFSGSLPAALCVHVADLTQDQLRELAEADRTGSTTGLQIVTSMLLESRPHLHTVAIMTDGDVNITRQQSENQRSTSWQEVGPSYVFSNPDHSFAEHPSLDRIFL